jgi:plasmid stabilization system protein ParE
VPLVVEFHPEARDDFYDAIDWYNGEGPDLGARFARAVEEAVRRVADALARVRAV